MSDAVRRLSRWLTALVAVLVITVSPAEARRWGRAREWSPPRGSQQGTLAGLPPVVQRALQRAIDANFRLRVLQGPRGERVFLLGETHLVPANVGRAIPEIVEAFPARAREGLFLDRYALGALNRLFIFGPRELYRRFKGYQRAAIDHLKQQPTSATALLEKEHRPGWIGHYWSVQHVAGVTLRATVVLGGVGALASGNAPLASALLAAWLGTRLYDLLAVSLLRSSDAPWVRAFAFPHWVGRKVLIDDRDETMAGAILRLNRSEPALLALLGMAHVPGVSQRLEANQYTTLFAYDPLEVLPGHPLWDEHPARIPGSPQPQAAPLLPAPAR
jgi:hypothetical protein